MPRRPNPLGDLLRTRRRASKVGYKQLHAITGVEPETMRRWETGDTFDVPLRGVILYALAVGISLQEIQDAVLADHPPREVPANGAGNGRAS